MKAIAPLAAAMICAVLAAAEVPVPGSPVKALKVLDKVLPLYPHELITLGVREGEARVAFSVDTSGRVDDCLAVAYTHPEFARVTINALKRWKFDPARYNDQPIAAATELAVRFEVEGTVVVSLTPSESFTTRIFALTDRELYRPRTLKELDRIPTPINAPSPAFPSRVATDGSVAQVTATFYIDEAGTVRLPSINLTDDAELGAAVIQALRAWKFEPPTCKGRPVLVRASQQFNFRPPAKSAAGVKG